MKKCFIYFFSVGFILSKGSVVVENVHTLFAISYPNHGKVNTQFKIQK